VYGATFLSFVKISSIKAYTEINGYKHDNRIVHSQWRNAFRCTDKQPAAISQTAKWLNPSEDSVAFPFYRPQIILIIKIDPMCAPSPFDIIGAPG
jgi:hypothetical protein